MNNKVSLTINILFSIYFSHFIFLTMNEFQFVAILFQCCQTMLPSPLLKVQFSYEFYQNKNM